MIRELNIKRIVDALRRTESLTITEISEHTSLSRATVQTILSALHRNHVVDVAGTRRIRGTSGKPPKLFSFNPTARHAVGMQLSFDCLHAKLVDLNYETRAEFSVPIQEDITIEQLLSLIKDGVASLTTGLSRGSVVGLGFGGHGVTDIASGVILTSPHNPSWGKYLELRDLIMSVIDEAYPVYVDNAIRYRTLSEQVVGRLKAVNDAIVIHCSEGIIAGLISDGHVRRGKNNLVGAIGHMKINEIDDEPCKCGGTGCFEMQVAPSRVMARFPSVHSIQPSDEDSAITPSDKLKLLFTLANEGDHHAKTIVSDVARWFAITIHNSIVMIDPEVVVIQGLYAEAGWYFLSELHKHLNLVSLVNIRLNTRIEYSNLGEEAGATGAAYYAVQRFLSKIK